MLVKDGGVVGSNGKANFCLLKGREGQKIKKHCLHSLWMISNLLIRHVFIKSHRNRPKIVDFLLVFLGCELFYLFSLSSQKMD